MAAGSLPMPALSDLLHDAAADTIKDYKVALRPHRPFDLWLGVRRRSRPDVGGLGEANRSSHPAAHMERGEGRLGPSDGSKPKRGCSHGSCCFFRLRPCGVTCCG